MSNEENDRLRRLKKSEDETQGEYTPAPLPNRSGSTAKFSRPALDKDNMPLPRRVDEIDMDGTRVTPAAYEPTTNRRYAQVSLSPRRKFNWRSNWGCILRGLIVTAFAVLVIGVCSGSYVLYRYYLIASTLPDIGDL